MKLKVLLKQNKFKSEIEKKVKQFQKDNKPILLNLGCGSDIRDNWINIDEIGNEFLNNGLIKDKISKIIKYNCSLGLPLENEFADCVYSSHFFEHLTPVVALNLFKDSFKILKKKGLFRIALPDVAKTIKNIVNDTLTPDEIQLLTPERTMFKLEGIENKFDGLNYLIYQNYEHKYIYTPEKVIQILKFVGFGEVKQVEFNKDYDIDLPLRKNFSFYVEAIK